MRQRGVFWHHVFAGVLIGTGCVLPGVSGGVMAVSFGLYRPMLDAVLGFFRNAKRSFLFLLPIALGGSVGFLIAAKGLGFAMARFETPMLFLFAGFIIGGIPDLLREADQGRAFRPRCLWALALGIALALPWRCCPRAARRSPPFRHGRRCSRGRSKALVPSYPAYPHRLSSSTLGGISRF